MRRLALAIALASVLSGVTHAGEIHTTAPAPPEPGRVMTTGDIHSTDAPEPETSSTILTIILTLISIR